jgi:hypothetical protein
MKEGNTVRKKKRQENNATKKQKINLRKTNGRKR